MKAALFTLALAVSALAAAAQSAVPYPAEEQPGEACTWGNKAGDTTNLMNDVLLFCSVSLRQTHHLCDGVWKDGFSLVADGKEYGLSDFKQTNAVHVEGASQGVKLNPDAASPSAADREAGWGMRSEYRSAAAGVSITCQAELRDGAHYVKTHYTITADRDVTLTQFTPLHLKGAGFCRHPELAGSPTVQEDEGMFFCVVHPAAQTVIAENGAAISIVGEWTLPKGQSMTFTAAEGVFPAGQLRRAYELYLSREQAAGAAVGTSGGESCEEKH